MKKIRKPIWFLFSLLLSFALITACGGNNQQGQEPAPTPNEPSKNEPTTETPSQADQGVVAEGEEIVQKNCIGCHGGNLEGGIGPSLHKVSERYTEAEIKDILVNGKGSMSGGLAKGHEDAVVAYLLTLQ